MLLSRFYDWAKNNKLRNTNKTLKINVTSFLIKIFAIKHCQTITVEQFVNEHKVGIQTDITNNKN